MGGEEREKERKNEEDLKCRGSNKSDSITIEAKRGDACERREEREERGEYRAESVCV